MIAVVFFSYCAAAAAASVAVFRDAGRFDLERSRIARARSSWAFGTLVWLPLFGPLWLAARRRLPLRDPSAPRRRFRDRGDRYDAIVLVTVLLPLILVAMASVDSGHKWLFIGTDVLLALIGRSGAEAMAARLRGGPRPPRDETAAG